MPGTFVFRPIQATLTHDTDWLGKMDPYCAYRVGPDVIKGPVCRNGGKFPKWEDATIQVPATNEPSIVVDLMDKDKVLFDDNIGSFVIDLQEIQYKGQISKWYPVYYKKKPAGEILLEAAYQPELIQQQPIPQPQPVVEPVIVKEVVEPVIVEKVVVEEVRQVPAEKEFVHGGPIITGISQIHHGGQGYGLVPQHSELLQPGSTLHQGTTIPSQGYQGSTLNQGGIIYTSSLGQGGYQGPISSEGGIIHGTSSIGQGGIIQGTSYVNVGQGSQGSTLSQGGLNQGTNLQQGTSLGQGYQGSNLNQGSLNQKNI